MVAAERGVQFAWQVARSNVVWGYRMSPAEQGTELSEYTVFGAAGEEFFAATYGSDAQAQIAIRRHAAESGIVETLERIRAIVEGTLVRDEA